jgi:hypothetical protein
MENQTKTVKFEALKLIKEAEELLITAEQKLVEVEALQGDNEAQEFAETLRWSIERDRKTLHRGKIEAEELW